MLEAISTINFTNQSPNLATIIIIIVLCLDINLICKFRNKNMMIPMQSVNCCGKKGDTRHDFGTPYHDGWTHHLKTVNMMYESHSSKVQIFKLWKT